MANRNAISPSASRLQDNSTRFARVALSKNGRVMPDVVLVNGKEEKHPEGAYYIEWYLRYVFNSIELHDVLTGLLKSLDLRDHFAWRSR